MDPPRLSRPALSVKARKCTRMQRRDLAAETGRTSTSAGSCTQRHGDSNTLGAVTVGLHCPWGRLSLSQAWQVMGGLLRAIAVLPDRQTDGCEKSRRRALYRSRGPPLVAAIARAQERRRAAPPALSPPPLSHCPLEASAPEDAAEVLSRMRGALVDLVGSGKATRTPSRKISGLHSSLTVGCMIGLLRYRSM